MSSPLNLADQTQNRLAAAVREAKSWRHARVEPDHVLMSALKDEDSVLKRALNRTGTSPNAIKDLIERRLLEVSPSPGGVRIAPKFSDRLKGIFDKVDRDEGDQSLRWEQLLLTIFGEDGDSLVTDLRNGGLDVRAAREAVDDEANVVTAGAELPVDDALQTYCEDLIKRCEEGKIYPVIGRGDEIHQVAIILSQAMTNNALLVGDPGVGKTSIVEGLASLIHSGKVAPVLMGKRVLQLDLGRLLAGTKYRGEFEERLKKVVDAVRAEQGRVILFVDEIHSLMGAGRTSGGPDAANLIKPALARGELSLIGATTHAEFREHLEKDRPFTSRFERVLVQEPSNEETLQILAGIKERLEAHHAVSYDVDALDSIVSFASRYVPGEFFPRKAVKLMDRVGAEVAGCRSPDSAGQPVADAATVARAVATITKIPVDRVSMAGNEIDRLKVCLGERIVGQDDVIETVCNQMGISSAGLSDPDRPRAVVLFLGSTGVGKTEFAKIMATELYADPQALVRLDMSEFGQREGNIARLTGAPPGTVGYEAGGQLTEAVKVRPYSLVLLDEFDKADPEVWKVFQQVFDEGRLTDNKGQTVNFRNCIFIATSNQHADVLMEDGLGSVEERKTELIRRFRATCPAEFLKRMDQIIIFNTLSREIAGRILMLLVGQFERRLRNDPEKRFGHVSLVLSKEACASLLDTGFEPRYGARSLRNEFERQVGQAVARALGKRAGRGRAKRITVTCQDGGLRAVIEN